MRPRTQIIGPPVQSPNVNSEMVKLHTASPSGTRGGSLAGMAEIYYGDRRRWPDILNANRKGVTRPDGSLGFLNSPEDVRAGDRLVIP